MNEMFIESIGVATPGMLNWEQARAVLSGEEGFLPGDFPRYKPQLLPANERRRATDMIRLAFNVCEQATESMPEERNQLASIFSSSGGDYQVIDQICRVLTQDERFVSPTQFHNSVHNSAAGYWGIAAKSHKASTSLSACDNSFFAGLLEASLQVLDEEKLLLACYETIPPVPLREACAIEMPFAAGFVFSSTPTSRSMAKIEMELSYTDKGFGDNDRYKVTEMADKALEVLRLGNPAACALPLLQAVVLLQKGSLSEIKVVIGGLGNQVLEVVVSQC
ncbi:MAG: beta-ketoacyl synthase chain length factor [Agarilytica sp.]